MEQETRVINQKQPSEAIYDVTLKIRAHQNTYKRVGAVRAQRYALEDRGG